MKPVFEQRTARIIVDESKTYRRGHIVAELVLACNCNCKLLWLSTALILHISTQSIQRSRLVFDITNVQS